MSYYRAAETEALRGINQAETLGALETAGKVLMCTTTLSFLYQGAEGKFVLREDLTKERRDKLQRLVVERTRLYDNFHHDVVSHRRSLRDAAESILIRIFDLIASTAEIGQAAALESIQLFLQIGGTSEHSTRH